MIHQNFQNIETRIKKHFESQNADWTKSQNVEDYIRKEINQLSAPSAKTRLMDEYFGWGPLNDLIKQKDIKEIIINGPDNIWVEKTDGFKKIKGKFLSEKTYQNFIFRLLEEIKEKVHINKPYADGKWKDFRVHIISSPLNPQGFCICLRKHAKLHWSLSDLKQNGWANEKQIKTILNILESKENFIVVGPTSTGKTTSLNAFLSEMKQDRSVIIEDTDELISPNSLSTKLLTRTESDQFKNYHYSDLIKQALRMRPDRIVLGEIRGEEAKSFLIALSTGHQGSFASLHAKDSAQALIRLEMLIQMGAPQWNLESIRKLIFLSLKYIFVVKNKNNKKILEGIYKISSLEQFGFLVEKVI